MNRHTDRPLWPDSGCGREKRPRGRGQNSPLLLYVAVFLLLMQLGLGLSGCAADKKEGCIWLSDVLVEQVEDGVPDFTQEELTTVGYESYSALDRLGRCGTAVACVGPETMPDGERGKIGQVKPSGWHTVKYDSVDGQYLYNRCHLIAFQLTGENANERNLITGTRFLNNTGMLPYEEKVGDYVRETGNHVMYRVTPRFEGRERVARKVEMEALSVEDHGEGVSFHIYVYNVQPGILIDYMTGESARDPKERTVTLGLAAGGSGQGDKEGTADQDAAQDPQVEEAVGEYIVNKNTRRFHRPSCPSVQKMKEKNRVHFEGARKELIDGGLSPCETCRP